MKTLKVSRNREIVDMNAVYEDVGRDLQLLAVELEDCNPSLLLSTALYYRCRGVSPEAIVARWWGQVGSKPSMFTLENTMTELYTLDVGRGREIIDLNRVYQDAGSDVEQMVKALHNYNYALLSATAKYMKLKDPSCASIADAYYKEITKGMTFLKNRSAKRTEQVSHDCWSGICDELVNYASNASQSDLGTLMVMCAVYIVDPSNVVVIPPHLEQCGKLISLVRKDPLALTNISGMLAFYVQQQTMQ